MRAALALLVLATRAQTPAGPAPFTSVTLEGFTLVSGSPGKDYIIEANSGGLCAFDYNSDGLADIYLVNGGRLEDFRDGRPSSLRNALFLNLGGRRFRDVTEEAGVGGNGRWGMGCSVADYDGDGRLDLYVTTYGPNLLYRNRGDGTFQDTTASAGASDSRWSTGSAWADFDLDGDLDLFVANYIDLDPANLPHPGSPAYGAMGSVSLGCQYGGLPVACGPRGLAGAGDALFVNQGDGTFQEASRAAGVHDPDGYYGLGAVWADFNDDGLPDLYVANDTTPNYLYRNLGGGRLEEIGLLSGTAVSRQGVEQAGMGLAVGDYLNEGPVSVYVTNFSQDYNTLYRNIGDFNFNDVTVQAGLARDTLPLVGWGALFLDYDNDGWLDLFVSNGHVFPIADRLQTSSVAPYRQANLLFRNAGSGRFEPASKTALGPPLVSRGAVMADFDNDGGMDLVVSNLDWQPTLLWNSVNRRGHYLHLALRGRPPNASAVGSRVFLSAGGLRQRREVRSGSSYLSQSDLRLHFGLGPAEEADKIEILWPSGKKSVLKDIAADQALTIEEP